MGIKNRQRGKIVYYRRYIDNLFFVWDGSVEEAEKFAEYLNVNNAGLQFTHEFGSTSINFLDVTLHGLFRLIADETPYCSIGELTRELYVRPSHFGLLRFRSDIDLEVGNFTVSKDEQILIRDLKEVNEVMSVNCEVLIKGDLHSFDLPLSYEGKFYECQDEKTYTLNEILSWKIPSNRKRNVVLSDVMEISDISKLCPKGLEWFMVLKPVYEVEAMLQFRHDIICLLSDLDIDVIDITHRFDMKYFSQMVTTHEIFERNSKEFPMIVEIISSPVTKCIFSNLLMPGKKIIIHKKHQSDRVIASEFSSYSPKKHFLIPSNYKGKFKRKARMFSTVYDLRIAKNERDDLHVVATKAFHSPYKEFSSICVGDQFLVKTFQSKEMLFEGKKTVVDALICIKMTETPFTEVSLPLYVEGGFVEVVHDKKKYYLTELCKSFQLPLNVKVSIRDLFAVGEDILATTSVLQLEEQITDSYLLVSTLNRPEEVWELPVQRQNLTVQLISSFQGKTFSSPTRTNIEEVNEEDYYMLRRYENQVQHPPPRPPKTPLCAEPATKIPEVNVIPK
ncbi:protein THEMIS-like, partial [Bombina bombina]|uniref:protein THEMIS-like n=1 Tax=Bombina bombina TaxID=8345 RepID=UPI00235AE072